MELSNLYCTRFRFLRYNIRFSCAKDGRIGPCSSYFGLRTPPLSYWGFWIEKNVWSQRDVTPTIKVVLDTDGNGDGQGDEAYSFVFRITITAVRQLSAVIFER